LQQGIFPSDTFNLSGKFPYRKTLKNVDDLKEKTIRGGVARLCAQVIFFLLRIGTLVILARILGPKDFGLVGMVTAFTGILNLFRDFGLSTATVQRLDVSEEQISTLFWVNIGVGAILTALTLAAAPFVASFYHEPVLVYVTAVLAACFLFNAAGVQHSALLQREMRFTELAIINVVSQTIGMVVGIGMAIGGYRYWSLVALTLSIPLVSSICLWVTTKWVPAMPRDRTGVRSMVRFGGTVTLNTLVVYLAYNMDKVLLGRFWGAQALGIYGRAYQFINIPMDNFNSAVGEVAFSALSRIQDNPSRLRDYFLKGYSLALSLTIPITIICAVFSYDLIFVLLGEKWNEAAPIFRALVPTVIVFALINPLGWLLLAVGQIGRSLKIAFVIAPLVISGYLIGLPYGPKGVALGFSTALMLWLLPHIFWCTRGSVISFRDICVAAGRPLFAGAGATMFAWVAQLAYGHLLSALSRLVVGCAILLLVYLALLLFGMKQMAFYRSLLEGWRDRTNAGSKVAVSAQTG